MLAALAVLLVLALALFDWNWLRGPIEREVTRSTGRALAIKGDLEVDLSLRPLVVAHDVAFGNAAWAREPLMATARSVAFRIDLLGLLAGRLAFPEVALSQPHIALEVNRSGEA